MNRQRVSKNPEPDYKTDKWDGTPLPDERSGDPTSLSGIGGGMFTEMSRAVRLALVLSPVAILGAYGLAHWATGLVNSRAEREAIKNTIFFDDEALEVRRAKIMTAMGEIAEFKRNFSEIEKPTTQEVAAYERELREREAKWRKQAIAYNSFRDGVIDQAKQIGESAEDFPAPIELSFDHNTRQARQ